MKDRKRKVKVPVILQVETMECGAASLAMILASYGKWISVQQLRKDCGVSKNGVNAKSLVQTARFYGLKAQGKRYNLQKLKDNAPYPCILYWGFNHFVVLKDIKGRKAYINDPARGDVVIDEEEMKKNYTGVCLVFEPDESFTPSGARPSLLKYAFSKLSYAGTSFVFMILTLFLSGIMEMILPMFSRTFVDYFLEGMVPQYFLPFMLLMILFCALILTVQLISSFESYKINAGLTVYGSSSFMWKVFHLPMEFFSGRRSSDILSTKDDSTMIYGMFVNTIAPMIVNSILTVFYLVVMIRIDVILSILCVVNIALSLSTARFIARKRENLTRRRTKLKSRHVASTVSAFHMIESIKACGAEEAYFADWMALHTAENNVGVESIRLNNYLGSIPGFLNTLINVLLIFAGSLLIFHGKFGIGLIMAFQALYNGMNKPVTQVIETQEQLQETTAQVERIEDTMSYPEDNLLNNIVPEDGKVYEKLTGSIEIKGVTYGYDRVSGPVIHDFSMKLEPGRSVALVGASGSGKSTIGSMISGLAAPWEGEILYDGKKLSEIDKTVFRSSLAVVDQDIVLFADSIRSNIKMYDETITDEDMINGARTAQIHDAIVKRKGGYDYVMRDNGTDFSGGERQRLEIARALAMNPSILVMDEATSALDSRTEYDLVEAVRERGCACVVIAHRLSTIRSCDEIIVLKDGDVVDRGRHEELLARCEYYRTLITAV